MYPSRCGGCLPPLCGRRVRHVNRSGQWLCSWQPSNLQLIKLRVYRLHASLPVLSHTLVPFRILRSFPNQRFISTHIFTLLSLLFNPNSYAASKLAASTVSLILSNAFVLLLDPTAVPSPTRAISSLSICLTST